MSVTATSEIQANLAGKATALRRTSVLALALMGGGALGCDSIREVVTGQSQALCDQALPTVRQAIEFRDFELARKWRDYAWKVCPERGFVATLDKELVTAEEEHQKELAEKAKESAELAQKRLNAVNVMWLKLDRDPKRNAERTALERTRDSAERLATGLDEPYAKQLTDFNRAQFDKRVAALKP